MKCVDCPYYWIDDGEQYGCCHYRYNDGYAPCEVADEPVTDEPTMDYYYDNYMED